MKIAVLGAGVGGLSVSIALNDLGHEVKVYERHLRPKNMGAGIVLWPNACFVLDQLGLLKEVEAKSGQIQQMQRVSSENIKLGAIDIVQLNERMGYPSYSILRSDFMAILRKRALSRGVRIYDGRTVSSFFESTTGNAQAFIENGKIVEADLIIGADGRMNSTARSFVHGDNKPVYQGFSNWVGVYQSDRPLFDDMTVRDYWGVGARFGIVPVSAYQVYWAGALAEPEIGCREPALYKKELINLFEGWPEPILKIIHGTTLGDINKIYVHDHEPIDVWHRRNVLLIGDAVHAALPTSGQGACQALEDTWHLAQLLRRETVDLVNTLEEFTKLRLDKTRSITMAGRQLATSLFYTDPAFCRQRNLAAQAADYRLVLEGMAELWGQGLSIGE